MVFRCNFFCFPVRCGNRYLFGIPASSTQAFRTTGSWFLMISESAKPSPHNSFLRSVNIFPINADLFKDAGNHSALRAFSNSFNTVTAAPVLPCLACASASIRLGRCGYYMLM
ncbi:hypothetical protein A8C56_14890 [Niabella ginsenosidivorans]|uniref:Uncharacterized protein n=1 Tax=Niabella ginsenosidivorans TaxID=1176587 RepID=A0A1A9I343_9BACT|nr:hypothetical protein A8C56_14890 [Niabella ginsenosidivorans]